MACGWGEPGHSLLQGRGGTAVDTLPTAWPLARRGSAERLRMPPLFGGRGDFSGPEDLSCAKGTLVRSCQERGAPP